MIVLPFVRARLCRILHIPTALKLSSPDVGSSRTIKDGSVTSSTPIDVRFRSPPDMVFHNVEPIGVFLHCSRPNSLMIRSTLRFCMHIVLRSFSRAANVNASFTVKYSKRTSSYMTYAPYLLNVSVVRGKQSLSMREPFSLAFLSTLILPLSALRSVVFPAPEAPMM